MKRVLSIVFLVSLLVCALNVPGRLAWAGPNEDLIHAARVGDVAGVRAALRSGADVNAENNKYGLTPLEVAAQVGHANVIPLLLRAGADVNARDKSGATALIEAAFRGQVNVIPLLLKAGADVNARDKYGNTALIEAALFDHASVIPLLLKAGADVNARDKNGDTARDKAYGSSQIITSLLDDWKAHHSGNTVANNSPSSDTGSAPSASSSWAGPNVDLIQASLVGDLAGVRSALRAGADVNARGPGGDTALILAAINGRANVIPLLLKAGADVNARDKDGMTPLMSAVGVYGRAAVIPLLLKAGADVNARDKDGNTARDLAAGKSKSEIISLLDDWKASHSGTAVASNQSSSSGLSQSEAQNIAAQAAKQAVEQANAKNAQKLAAMNRKLAALSAKTASPKVLTYHSSVDRPSFNNPENRHMFALVIGVEHYPGGLPDAQFADRDARAVYRTLIALGVPPDHIKRLTDGTATRGRIKEGIRWLGRNAKPDSTVWVYFSGHGAPGAHGHAYLVPFGGDPNDLADTATLEDRFYKDLDRLPAKRVLVALDACFSGTGGRSVLGKGLRPLTLVRKGSFPRTGKVIAFSAARSDQEAGPKESAGHGLFTYYFLKGLDGGAERQGRVTVGSLSRYLKAKVPEAANLDNRDQVPQVEPSPVGPIAEVRIR